MLDDDDDDDDGDNGDDDEEEVVVVAVVDHADDALSRKIAAFRLRPLKKKPDSDDRGQERLVLEKAGGRWLMVTLPNLRPAV